MARITVQDCLKNVDNRFELVLLATKRARQLATTGIEPLVPWENDKVTVVALREIAAGLFSKDTVDEPHEFLKHTGDILGMKRDNTPPSSNASE